MKGGNWLCLFCQFWGNIHWILTWGASFYSSFWETLFSPYLWIQGLPLLCCLSVVKPTQCPHHLQSLCSLGGWELVYESVLFSSGIWKVREESSKKWCFSMLVAIVTVGFSLLSYDLAQADSWDCVFFLEKCGVSYIRWSYRYPIISFLIESFVILVVKTSI